MSGAPEAAARHGRFGRLFLPAIILQSVLIGGGYATGREIVAYGARFGAHGWWSVGAIFVGFTLMAFLTFEVARVRRAYTYKRFIEQVIGPLWPAFDLLFVAMAVLIIAVMASAAGSIMRETLGVPEAVGSLLIVVVVGLLTFFGARVIELFKSVGSGILYAAYVLFSGLVLAARWPQLKGVLEGPAPGTSEAGIGAALLAGVLYVGYNLAIFPAVLFCLHRQRSRADAANASLVSGVLMTLPFVLTFLCLLSYYPSAEVLDAPVPWLPMLQGVGGGAVIALFGLVMGWTLLETSVGLIHAIVDRVDAAVRDRQAARGRGAGLSRAQSSVLGVGILLAAMALSRVGIITLVARGYSLMGYLFILLFALPLLTVGAYRVFKRPSAPTPSSAPARSSPP